MQPGIFKADILPNLRAGQTVCFCHGFSVLYGQIVLPKDVNCVLYVPNAPGAFVRSKYLQGEGVYGCVSVDHDATGNAMAIVLAISKAVGSTRAGVVEMTFQHETEGDNFEEQILYGGAIALMRACFNVMVENGYPPSFAYAKAIRSLRSVLDVMDERGRDPPRVRRDRGRGVRPGLDAGVGPGHAAAAPAATDGPREQHGADRHRLAAGLGK